MRKLVILAALSLTAALFAQEAQEEEVLEPESVEEVEEFEEAAAPAPVAEIAAVKEESAPAPVAEVKEEKKSEYPKIKQSGGVNITPRMEVGRVTDEDGKKFDGTVPNHRRFMFTWGYKLSVAVNEKLDLTFRLSDPWGETFGAEIYGSGQYFRLNNSTSGLLGVALPNAFFTWKPADAFHFSGGLLNVASNTALDIQAAYTRKDPTRAFGNEYGNSLAGFDFTFPINKTLKVFAVAGIANPTFKNRLQFKGEDTIGAYSDARILVGADLSLADKKVTLKPNVNILTTGKTFVKDEEKSDSITGIEVWKEVSRGLLISEGVDANVKITKQFSVNANVGALHHNAKDVAPDTVIAKHATAGNYTMVAAGIEPVFTFGGENNKLFTTRVKYAFDWLKNGDKEAVSKEAALGQHVDARFGVAVNEKLSITPRLRYWRSNAKSYYDRAFNPVYDDDNKSAYSFLRWEIGFAASF